MNITDLHQTQKWDIHTVGGYLLRTVTYAQQNDDFHLSTETVSHKPSSDTRLYPRNQNLNSLFFVRLRISQKRLLEFGLISV